MSPLLIENAALYTPQGVIGRGWLHAASGRIQAYGPGTPPDLPGASRLDARGASLLPGFIDVHVHGARGHDTMDADPEGLRSMARFFARHGVTCFLPTTMTEVRARINAALRAVRSVMGPVAGGASIAGAHLEGPYLTASKCGAQQLDQIRPADMDEAREWLDLDVIRLIALAPEHEANLLLLDECVRRGVAVSAAHTDATYEQMRAAFARGLRQSTHTYNAMRGLHHRDPGTLGAALEDERVRCELIADNIHVHPGAMRLLWKLKGPRGVLLVTDAMAATGMPDGDYHLGSQRVSMRANKVTLADGTLAGSALTFDAALRNFQAATGASLAELWPTASLNAAEAIGLGACKGRIQPGYDADLVLLDANLNVQATIALGEMVYQAKEN